MQVPGVSEAPLQVMGSWLPFPFLCLIDPCHIATQGTHLCSHMKLSGPQVFLNTEHLWNLKHRVNMQRVPIIGPTPEPPRAVLNECVLDASPKHKNAS